MRPLIKTFTQLLCCMALLVGVAGCQKANPGYYHNDKIEADIREEMHDFSKNLLKALKNDDKNTVENMISRDLMESNFINTNGQAVSMLLKASEFELLDEYYIINKYTDRDTIKAEGKDYSAHTLIYTPDEQEMYIALFVAKSGANRHMITLRCAKYDYGWKVSYMQGAPYIINGKTAPQLYEDAKQKYQRGEIADAYLTLQNAVLCIQPSLMWEYTNLSALKELYYTVGNQANDQYKFPYVLSGVATKPAVISMYYKLTKDGNFPLIGYATKLDVHNKLALAAENKQVIKALGAAMPGLNTNNKYVYYSIYKALPGGEHESTSTEFVYTRP